MKTYNYTRTPYGTRRRSFTIIGQSIKPSARRLTKMRNNAMWSNIRKQLGKMSGRTWVRFKRMVRSGEIDLNTFNLK